MFSGKYPLVCAVLTKSAALRSVTAIRSRDSVLLVTGVCLAADSSAYVGLTVSSQNLLCLIF